MDDLIKEIHADTKHIREEQIKIRKDLDYHIRRTDVLEDSIKPMHKA